MKYAAVLALVLAVGVGFALAADTATTKPVRPLMGKIVSVAADGKSLVVKTTARRGGEGKEVTVTLGDKAPTITLDGKEAKMADLKADMFVKVTPAEGAPEKIEAMTKMPERSPRAGAAGAGGDAK